MSLFIATSSAAYWRQALPELRQVDTKIHDLQPLAPGVVRFASHLERAAFLARLPETQPIFLRHIQPVDLTVDLAGGDSDLAAIKGALSPVFASIRPGERIGIHVRQCGGDSALGRSGLKESIEPLIEAAGGHPVSGGGDRIIAIVLTEGQALIGIATAVQMGSDWPGGEMRFRRAEEQVSRAKFKLLEAFATFPIAAPDGGHALDLGAAPGGWTSLLLERGLRVTAVDTGAMAPSLVANPRLTVLQQNVETVTFAADRFDLITCDMSWNPHHTADLVLRLAGSVRSGAHGVLTVKLMLDNPTRTIRKVRERLDGAYQIRQVKQLFHNRDEVTMHLVRR